MKITQKAGIDIGKLLAAISVVYIHVPMLLTYSNEVNYWAMLLTRWAVPFFFVASAFFLFEKLNQQAPQQRKQTVLKYCKNIGKIWAVWTAVYLIYDILNVIFVRKILLNSVGMLLWYLKTSARAIVFDGISGHLWYLPATVAATLIVCFLRKKLRSKGVAVIVSLLFFIGLCGNTYKFLIPAPLTGIYTKLISVIVSTRNGLFWAPLPVLIGSLLSDNKEKLQKLSQKTVGICFLILFALMLCEGAVVKAFTESYDNLDMWITTVPLAVCIFVLFYNKDCKISSKNALAMRNMSLTVYLVHPMVIYILSAVAQLASLASLYDASAVYYLITLACSLGIAYIKHCISQKKHSK